jgi:NodT family efflux transporter outer membrane factor (OMF) lipoprotein
MESTTSCSSRAGSVAGLRDAKRTLLLAVAAVAIASIGLGLAGCEVGPNYRPPEQKATPTWVAPPTTQASVTVQQPLQVDQWWTTFNDPTLDSLIRRAAVQNLDLLSAAERIRQARALLNGTSGTFWPMLNANGSYTRSFAGGKGSSVVVTGTNGNTATLTSGPHARDFFQSGFDATWELDVFGGVRRSIEAAGYQVDFAIEDRRDVLITVYGEVASDYIALRGFQQEIVIAQENLAIQIHSLGVTQKKVVGGTTTALDVANAQAQVATTRSEISSFESSAQQEIYALSVLLGQEPLTLQAELSPAGEIPRPPSIVAVGIPSELLRRRPDIRRAERQLASTTAQIGVATAQLFPRFTFNGTLTVGGNNFSSLGSWGHPAWSFGPAFSWPIFDAGQIWSNIEVQNSLQRQALLSYRSTVLTAFQDVETQLTAYALEQQRRVALNDAVDANKRAVALAKQRYDVGQTDFLNLLVAQQSLFGSQDSLVQSDRNIATDLVALYKALGGGWQFDDPAATQPTRQ